MSAEDIPDSEVLFDHLTHVLLRIVKDSPNDAFGSFESISAQVKKDKAGVKAAEDLTALASPSSPSEDEAALAAQKTAALAAHQLNLNLIKAPKKEKADGDEGDEPEEEEPEQVPIPDIQAQHKLLNWAGVDFGAEEAYKLSLSIQKLATAKTFSETRFWGKIYGTKSNYYIVEAKLEEYPEAEDAPPELEPLGQGANEYIYYVTNSLVSQNWTQLPAVQPKFIEYSRNVRVFLTGDLNAPVQGFPRFPWKEAAYLRAQIARISHSNVIIPVGVYNIDAEDPEAVPEPNEEYKPRNLLLMDSPKSWVHARQNILKIGRVTPIVKEEEEEDEEEMSEEKKAEKAAAAAAKEKVLPRLRSIAQDESSLGDCWSFRIAPNPLDSTGVVAVTSCLWPGATTVYRGASAAFVYVGWGHKLLDAPYRPPNPPAFQSEYQSPFELKLAEVDPLLEQRDNRPPAGWVAPVVTEEVDEGDESEAEGGVPAEPAAEEE